MATGKKWLASCVAGAIVLALLCPRIALAKDYLAKSGVVKK